MTQRSLKLQIPAIDRARGAIAPIKVPMEVLVAFIRGTMTIGARLAKDEEYLAQEIVHGVTVSKSGG